MEMLSTMEGKLKVGVAILGIFTIGFVAGEFAEGNSSDDYALAIVVIAFIVSLLLLVLTFLNMLPDTIMWKNIELVIHGVITIMLAIGALVFLINTARWGKHLGGGWKTVRAIGIILSIIETAIYGFLTFLLFQKRQATAAS